MSKAERRMLFSTCTMNEGIMYAFTSFGGVPVKIDLANEEMICINDLKNYQPIYADGMLNDRENIFVLELNGKRMLRYDITKNECFYYNIYCGKKDWGNYAVHAIYKGCIYIFPTYADEIVMVDMQSGEVQKDSKLYSKISTCENHGVQEDFSYFYCGCQVENSVWLFRRRGNLVVAYDMETYTWKEFRLSQEINNCEHVIQYADKLYILSSEGKIYSWNMVGESVVKVADCSGMETNGATFSRIVVTDKNIFLMPALGEDIFCIDLCTKQVRKYNEYPNGFAYCCPKGWGKYYGYCDDGDDCYFAMRPANYMFSVNQRTGKERWIKLKVPSSEEYVRTYLQYNISLLNESECQIEDIISYCKNDSIDGIKSNHSGHGERIWRQISS